MGRDIRQVAYRLFKKICHRFTNKQNKIFIFGGILNILMNIRLLPFTLLLVLLSCNVAFSQTVSIYAGNPNVNKLDGNDTNATFSMPTGLAMDHNGNIYVADFLNDAIRKITPAGQVTTFATKQMVPDLNQPDHLAVDSSDNVYYANRFGTFVGKITPAGVGTIFAGSNRSGQMDTFANLATFYAITGLLPGNNGTLYVADRSKLRKIENGRVSTVAGKEFGGYIDGSIDTAMFSGVNGMVRDNDGNIFVLDAGNWKIRKINTTGIVSTIAGSGTFASVDGIGTAASFKDFKQIAIDRPTGDLYITEQMEGKIRKVTQAGAVTTITGGRPWPCALTNGPAAIAAFCSPHGIVIDPAGNLYVSEANDVIRKINTANNVSTFAGNNYKLCINGADALNSSFNRPMGTAFDSSGNLYVADHTNQKIRKVSRSGVVTTFCGSGLSGSQNGSASNTSFSRLGELVVNKKTGMVYVLDDFRIRAIDPNGNSSYFAGSGAQANIDGIGTAASISAAGFMCIDTAGNLFLTNSNNKITKVTPGAVVSTYAHPQNCYNLGGITADKSGNIYFAHSGPSQGIQKIDVNRIQSHYSNIIGGVQEGLACDSRNNIYVADGAAVKMFTNGTYIMGFGRTPAGPQFLQLTSLSVDDADNIYMADLSNVIFKITTPPGQTKVQSLPETKSLFIAPNPNKGIFDIMIQDMADNVPVKISVTNMIGQTVYSDLLTGNNGRFHLDLSTFNLNPGIYFVSLPDRQIQPIKFLLNR